MKPVRREPKIGRNDPCPCGSGRKYKRCCEARTASRWARLGWYAVLAALLVAGLIAFERFREGGQSGPARVWSAEHGHYHTVP